MSCPYCGESDNYTTNGTAGYYCETCHKFFNEHWWAVDHEEEYEEEPCNAEKFIFSCINEEKSND